MHGGSIVTALLVAAPALAAVDLEVSLKTSSRGTIAAPDEVETYRFDATAGTVVKITVSGSGMDLAVTLTEPGGSDVPIDLASGYENRGSRVGLTNYTLGSTGTWTLRISSAEAGDYKLKIKGKPAKKIAETFTVDAGDGLDLTLSAPAGSTVKLKAKRASGSSAEQRIGDFDGADRTDEGKSSSKKHAVQVEEVTGGDHPLVLRNVGAASGDIKLTAKIEAPGPEKPKLDVTDEGLGGSSGSGTALSRRVDGSTGGLLAVDDAESPIDGASVAITAGVVTGETTVSISSAPDETAPEGRQTAGPTVEFGPAGLTFASPVEIKLPYDPSSLPPDATVDDLRVLHVKGKGVTETLVPTKIDEVNHELTVETTSFSKFLPNARRARRTWWVAATGPSSSTSGSRRRAKTTAASGSPTPRGAS